MRFRDALFPIVLALSAASNVAGQFPQMLFIRDTHPESSSSAGITAAGCRAEDAVVQWGRFWNGMDNAVPAANDSLMCYKGFQAFCDLKIHGDTVQIRVTYRESGEFDMVLNEGVATIRERHPKCGKAKLAELCANYKSDSTKSNVVCSGSVITYNLDGDFKCIDKKDFAEKIDIRYVCDYWIVARDPWNKLEHITDIEEKR